MTTNAEQQLALIHDPVKFAEHMWSDIFMDFDNLLSGEAICGSWADQHEAFVSIKLAATYSGADIAGMVDWSQDIVNSLAIDMQHIGVQMGVVLEQLRQSILAYLDAARGRGERVDRINEIATLHLRDKLKAAKGGVS